MKKMRLFLSILGFVVSLSGTAQTYRTVSLNSEVSWPLTHAMYYFSTAQALTPVQAYQRFGQKQAESLQRGRFTHGYDSKYYWYYLKLRNGNTPQTVVLTCNRADIHFLKYFAVRNNKLDTLAITGDAMPFESRPLLFNDFSVPISMVENEAIEVLVLVDKRNEFITGRFSLKNQPQFFYSKRIEFGWFMGYLGVVLFLLVFNVFLWYSLKDIVHILYIAQLFSSLMCISASLGYLHEFFLISIPYVTSTLVIAFVCIWAGFNFFLLLHFLKIKPSRSKFFNLNIWLGACNLVIGGLCLGSIYIIDFPLLPAVMRAVLIFMESLFVINSLAVVATIIEQLFKKNSMAVVYSIAWSFVFLGSLLSSVHRNFSLASVSFFDDLFGDLGWIIPGIMFEQITLAMGLTVRYNLLKKENLELDLNLSRAKSEMIERQIMTQEAERKRLAQDLHDDLGGTLSAIKGKISSEKVKPELIQLVDKAIRDLRLVSRDLMPPELEKEGLVKTVRHTVERLQELSALHFTFIKFGQVVDLGNEREVNIYRIMAELVNNIIRHSRATKAVVQLIYYEDSLTLWVEDNGIGIRTDEKSWGIGYKSISSRVEFLRATLHVDTSSHGTTVIIQIPFTPQATGVK